MENRNRTDTTENRQGMACRGEKGKENKRPVPASQEGKGREGGGSLRGLSLLLEGWR